MAIAFDAKVQNTSGATTYSHTVTGSNPILVVKVTGTATVVTGVTYAGVSMTLASFGTNIIDANTLVYQFYLKGPATGANNVVISGPASATSAAFSFTGASQTGGVDTATPYYNSVAESGNVTVTVNVSTANSWLIAAQDSSAVSPDSVVNGVFGFTTGNSTNQDAYSNADVGSGNQTIGYHWPSNDRHAIIALAFAPAGGGGATANNLTLLGVGT